jgi:hypothetical protein
MCESLRAPRGLASPTILNAFPSWFMWLRWMPSAMLGTGPVSDGDPA